MDMIPSINYTQPHKDFGWHGVLFGRETERPIPTKRGPIVHILDTGAYWNDKELGTDSTEDFITAALPYFQAADSPTLQQGDTIVGKDKNGAMVTILVVKIPDNPKDNEQKPPP
tara:strand:- start:5023 stop:5364 length:342 start_codon:yes stop_codon:yes gene_type:complete